MRDGTSWGCGARRVALALLGLGMGLPVLAVTGNEFWFAPPDVSDLHNVPGGEPLYLVVVAGAQGAHVVIDLPANAAFTPIHADIAPHAHARFNLTAFKVQLETRPTNTVLNTGLHLVASQPVSAVYEEANSSNGEDFALRGADALGSEFYVPLHKHAPFYNHTFAAPYQAYASFDIVASQDATQVSIYSPVPLDGHPALQQFSVVLNRGQTYSAAWTGTGYEQPSTHPAGAVVLADKPVAVTVKDDSDHNPSGGCYDLIGDQIVPVDHLGQDYVAVKGALNATGDESVVLVATRNNTQIYRDGATTPLATLFAGEYYRLDIDDLAAGPAIAALVHASQPVYAAHISGFGCEMGMALLPPLERSGVREVSLVRSDAQSFYLILVAPAAAIGDFHISSAGTASIPAASFLDVPGTGGAWKAARIGYNTTQVPADTPITIRNDTDRFLVASLSGSAASSAYYSYRGDFLGAVGLEVALTPQLASVPEPGDAVGYTVDVTNRGVGSARLDALVDSRLGSVQGQGCSLPQTLAAGATYHCAYAAPVGGNAGAQVAATLTAQGVSLSTALSAQATASVAVSDVLPTASLQATAPTLLGPDGGTATVSVSVHNDGSAEALRLTALHLDGAAANSIDLDGQGDCSLAAAQAIAAGASYACSATVLIAGTSGGSRGLQFVATLQDDEHNSVVASALSTVVFDARLFADGFE